MLKVVKMFQQKFKLSTSYNVEFVPTTEQRHAIVNSHKHEDA
jgi:hypothetical protein